MLIGRRGWLCPMAALILSGDLLDAVVTGDAQGVVELLFLWTTPRPGASAGAGWPDGDPGPGGA